MARRRSTKRYDDLGAFLAEYETTLMLGALMLPPGPDSEDLSAEVSLDIVFPLVGRVGPVPAQVVHRSPDGSVAVRIPDLGRDVLGAIERVVGGVEQVRTWLVETGQLIPADQAPSGTGPAVESPPGTAAAIESPPAATRTATTAKAPVARGFPVPDLNGIEPDISGSMADRSLRDAMVQVAAEKVTGLLTIRYEDGKVRYGFWDKGGPVGWRTDPLREAEVLGMLLYRAGQLTREQVAESLKIMERRPCRQGEALIEMGLLTFPQLIMVLGKQVEYVLEQALQEKSGTWTFHVLPSLTERFLPSPLRVPAMLFRALQLRAKEMSSTELYGIHRPRLDQYLSLGDEAVGLLDEIRLAAGEMKLTEIIRANSWRMRELFGVSPLSRVNTAAVLWAMDEMGFLVFSEHEGTERILARAIALIDRKRNQLLKGNAFDLLELHWICQGEEVEAAYARLKAEYESPVFDSVPEARRVELGKINKAIQTAYQTLKDDNSRRMYRLSVIEAGRVRQSAELLGKKGEMAIMRHDRSDAVACFSKAIELDPKNSAYREGLRRSSAVT